MWRYESLKKEALGWHFSVDDEGGESLLCLLDLFCQARWPCTATVRITRPTEEILRVPGMLGRAIAPARLRIQFPRGAVADETWSIESAKTEMKLVLGAHKLRELSDAIQSLLENQNDFAIGPNVESDDSNIQFLWFW